MDDEGIEKFYNSIGVQASDPVTLLISFAMEAKTGGEYNATEFKKGCKEINADTE